MWGRNRRGGAGARGSRHHGSNRQRQPGPPEAVGTEAQAKKNQERNAKDFRYPASGFVTPIEYTLLYAMLAVPKVYPEQVMLDTIAQEDFHEYMVVRPPETRRRHKEEEEEEIYSYAQLSALMNLAAEKWPPPPVEEGALNGMPAEDAARRSVPQVVCKAILQTVVRHAEEHDLERESEVQELLEPLSRLNEQKANQAGLALVVPMYLGLGASVVTGGNPLPLWIGSAVAGALSAKNTPGEDEQRNMRELRAVGQRMADAEKTGLLDDSED